MVVQLFGVAAAAPERINPPLTTIVQCWRASSLPPPTCGFYSPSVCAANYYNDGSACTACVAT